MLILLFYMQDLQYRFRVELIFLECRDLVLV
nr:MAG TPA: hypothetical protein [Caudoviricetes sp.]